MIDPLPIDDQDIDLWAWLGHALAWALVAACIAAAGGLLFGLVLGAWGRV